MSLEPVAPTGCQSYHSLVTRRRELGTDPDDVYAFIGSTAAGQEASPEECRALKEAIEDRFRAGGGTMTVTVETGCFVARDPR